MQPSLLAWLVFVLRPLRCSSVWAVAVNVGHWLILGKQEGVTGNVTGNCTLCLYHWECYQRPPDFTKSISISRKYRLTLFIHRIPVKSFVRYGCVWISGMHKLLHHWRPTKTNSKFLTADLLNLFVSHS